MSKIFYYENMHQVQIGILGKLLFKKELRYSDLKIDPTIENNTFQFHLNKIVSEGYVTKNQNGLYELTKEGKKLATHIDTDKKQFIKKRKVSVRLYCDRIVDGVRQVLVYTRKKHPFYGKQGFPAGKVQVGENFTEAASRELLEETGLGGNPILFSITHYLVKEKGSGELLEDKLFLDFYIKNPEGDLIGNEEGEFEWIDLDKLELWLQNPFDNNQEHIRTFEQIDSYSGNINFCEAEHITSDF